MLIFDFRSILCYIIPKTIAPLCLSMPYPHNHHRRRLGWTEFVTLVAHWISLWTSSIEKTLQQWFLVWGVLVFNRPSPKSLEGHSFFLDTLEYLPTFQLNIM